jgi:DNA invertase Pin-like site-specific DNA recombinase
MQKPKTIAYLRVSTSDQDLEKNKFDILQLANERGLGQVKWVEEKITTRVAWRKRQIANLLEQLQRDDNLIVSELSRLGRSMLECMEILSIAFQKGIHIDAVKGNWRLENSIQSKIVAMAFSMAAEIERDLIGNERKRHWQPESKRASFWGDPAAREKANSTIIVPRVMRCSETARRKSSLPCVMGQPKPT